MPCLAVTATWTWGWAHTESSAELTGSSGMSWRDFFPVKGIMFQCFLVFLKRASCFNDSLSFYKGHHVSMFPCLLLALERLTEERNLVYLCCVVNSNCQQGMLCMLTAAWPCSPGHKFLSFVSASSLPFAIVTLWDHPISFVSILFLPLLLKHHGTAQCLLFQSCFFLYCWTIMELPSVFCFNLVSSFTVEPSWNCPVSFVSILFLPLLLKHHGTALCLSFQSCLSLFFFIKTWDHPMSLWLL